jgi:hypothetical protein
MAANYSCSLIYYSSGSYARGFSPAEAPAKPPRLQGRLPAGDTEIWFAIVCKWWGTGSQALLDSQESTALLSLQCNELQNPTHLSPKPNC